MTAETAGQGAAVEGGDDDGSEHSAGVEDGVDRCALVENPRAPVTSGPVGPAIEPSDSHTTVEGVTVSGGGFEGAGGSGGSGGGVGPSTVSPLRNPMHRKDPIVAEEEETRDVRAKDVMFQPAAQSLSHKPITREDFMEYLSDERLTRLLEEHPGVGIAVLLAREERQREVKAAEAAARAERERAEGEEALRDMEAAERARAEAELPKRPAATVAAGMERAAFSAMASVPPTPHLFVPSGFATYRPR